MSMSRFLTLCVAIVAAAASLVLANTDTCTNPVKCDTTKNYFKKINLKHIKTISQLTFANTYVDLTIKSADKGSYPYRLVQCGCPSGDVPSGTQVIFVPPRRLYMADSPTIGMCTHAVQVADRITAVKTAAYIYASSLRSRITKDTPFAALRNNPNVDVAFLNFDGVKDYRNASTGKPFFVNGESDEDTPFARSEWIKIFGLMFNRVEVANIEFQEIVDIYTTSKKLASSAGRRPSVVLNYPFGTTWSQPSEKQYITELLRDANVDFLFMNDGKNTTNTLPVEEVAQKFKWARYLINTGPFPPKKDTSMTSLFANASTETGKKINTALRSMAAVHCANVWLNQKRIAGEGFSSGNDYFEWGATRPDLILRDMVHMFHPNIDVGAQPVFSFKLKDAPENVKGGSCPYNDLLGKAPKGMAYVDTTMDIKGMNRFDVENLLVEKIIPEVSKNSKIDAKAIDGFFEKPQANASTTFVLRTMVKEPDVQEIINKRDSLVSAVRTVLKPNATVVGKSSVSAEGFPLAGANNSSSRLSGGAIAGIVVGTVLLALLIAAVLYVIGSKRGRQVGENEMRDRYWNEHQVRLADDAAGEA